MKPCKCECESCCKDWHFCLYRKDSECWFYVINHVLSKVNDQEEDSDE